MAEYEFAKADKLIPLLDKKAARPVKAIRAIYRRYFDIMKNRGWEIISPKPKISRLDKLSLAVRAYLSR